MKAPILLSGHTMTPVGPLRPQSMQLTLRTDGLSGGTLVLDENNPDVSIGAWIQVWAPNGESCVMYAKSVRKDYITGTNTVTLEHTFGLLSGMVVFGEIDAAAMSGTLGATTCTVTQAITYLLGQQTESLWTLYECDFTDAQGWKFTNSDIYADLNSLTDAIADCQWEFDQSVFPWRLSLKAWPTTATMELRRNRNLETLRITQDRSGMYTRVYPTGKKDLHITGDYIDRNTDLYGVIANVITDSTISDEGLLRAWATKQLKRNAQPKYTVSITGYELSQATGESLDKLVIGRLCRIPLPEYGTTVSERLTELSWKDIVTQPESVTCTLANELKTITGVLNEKARGGGGGSKKANTEHDCDLKEGESRLDEFENADIWINKDSVWAVCGSYEVTTWVEGGVTKKKLKMKDGTSMTLERNHTEYGVYDEGNLTGGIMIDKVNKNGDTTLKIKATQIDIDGIVGELLSKTIKAYGVEASDIYGYDYVHADIGVQAGQFFTLAGTNATWQTKTVVTGVGVTLPSISRSASHYFLYSAASGNTTPSGTQSGRVITSFSAGSVSPTTDTIYYLGSSTAPS